MNAIIKSIIFASVVTIFSCRGERWDDDLSLPKQNYTGNQLKVDGYFYSFSDNDYAIYFLYRNGTALKTPYISSENLFSSEQEFMNGSFYSQASNKKYYWGRFIVNGSKIQIEYWKANTGPFEAYINEGVIMNDSTFIMTKSWRSCKPKKVREFNTIYHFKKFSPKPDSTNSYTN